MQIDPRISRLNAAKLNKKQFDALYALHTTRAPISAEQLGVLEQACDEQNIKEQG